MFTIRTAFLHLLPGDLRICCWKRRKELTNDIRLPFSLGEKRKLRAARGSGITATRKEPRSPVTFLMLPSLCERSE